MSQDGLDGARVVVTGSSRGIGAAIAIALIQSGARVIINFRANEIAARAVLNSVPEERRADVFLCQADVRHPDDVHRLIETCVGRFGGMDGLVNNAHTAFTPTPFQDLSWENVLDQINGSLKSAVLCTKEAVPHLLQSKRASVLNISSISTDHSGFHMSARAAAKGAVEGLTRSLAGEYGKQGVRFNALSVGWTNTDQICALSPNRVKSVIGGVPLGRLATPSEIASTAVFLLSTSAAYITGSVFPVAGGLSPEPR
jgi:3-oxoacyl-[acyl-carrier protein] reductase